MKLSVQTSGTLDVIGVEAGMKAIAEAGFEALDLDLDSHMSYEELKSGEPSELYNDENIYPYIDKIKAEAEKYGISFGQAHAPAPLFVKGYPKAGENVQNDVRKCIMLCEYAGCTRLVVHPIFDGSARFPSMTKEEEFKANIDFFSSLIPL